MAGSPENAHSRASKAFPLLEQWTLEVRRTLDRADRDQVHDLRVASRRFGQMIAVLDGASAAGVGKIRRGLKEIIGLAGAVRDYDIAAKLIGKLNAPARLQTRLRARRADAANDLVAALREMNGARVAEKWRARLPSQNGAVTAAERQVLEDAVKRLFARGARLDQGPRALHKLRIAAKKLRYTMELLPFSPDRLEPIKQLQSKLGDINDYESTRRLVAKEGASQTMIEGLKEAQEKKTKQFRRFWKRDFAGKEDGWRTILTHPSSETVKRR